MIKIVKKKRSTHSNSIPGVYSFRDVSMRKNCNSSMIEGFSSDNEGQPVRKKFKNNLSTINIEYNLDPSSEEEDAHFDSSEPDNLKDHEDNIMSAEKFNSENSIHQERKESNDETVNLSFLKDNKMKIFNTKHGTTADHFDKQGSYVSQYDPNDSGDEDEDDIFQGGSVNKLEEIQKVAEAHKIQLLMLKKRERQVAKNRRKYMLDEALLRLYYFTKNEYTVLETLSYFNSLRKSSTNDIEISTFSNAIDLLTDLIEILEKKGIEDVYELTRPKIKKLLDEEESLSGISNINKDDKVWSFKWINDLQKIHEFYSNYEMNYWKHNYFKGKVIVKYKEDDDIPKNWIHISCITFM